MKLVFEGESLLEIYVQMQGALRVLYRAHNEPNEATTDPVAEKSVDTVDSVSEKEPPGDLPETDVSEVQGPSQGPSGPGPRKPPVSAKHKTSKPKPKAAKAAKVAKAAKPVPMASKEPAPAEEPAETGEVEWTADPLAEADEAGENTPSPAEMATLRVRTIEALQAAYADGRQKQVFDLLAKYGNGAKSFRELQNDAFLPIRKAIDGGALA